MMPTGMTERLEAGVGRGVHGFSGATLRRTRLSQNLTIDDLAVALEVSDSTVRRWELGLAFPLPHNLRAIAEALDIGLADLLASRISPRPNLKDLRALAALTLEEVAEQSVFSRSSLLRLERGSMHLSETNRLALARAYGVTEAEVAVAYAQSVDARARRSADRRAQARSG